MDGTTRRWSIAKQSPELARYLADQLAIHPVVGQLLINRGVREVEQGKSFLDRRLGGLHDPTKLPGVEQAADRIAEAARSGKRICIHGDYDVDGMCGTAILLECLRLAGNSARFHVPDRLEEGYGVSADAIRRLRVDEKIDLVVTVDCGITSVEEAELARSLGLEYIVTDHHDLGEHLPDALLVHPRLPGSTYPFGSLCGAAVAYKLAWEIARRISGSSRVSDAYRKFLLDATVLAAVGTICDVVPLLDENRILVHHGLHALSKTPPLGLDRLLEVSDLKRKSRLAAEDVAFRLGPRLNACGRLGQARLGVELLTTRDETRALELAKHLEDSNAARQTLERRIFSEAKEMAEREYDLSHASDDGPIVLAGEQWHAGVIGIVAARMVERFHRPCVLIAWNGEQGTGSARGVPGVHLQQALFGCQEHLIACGGHAMAAGLRIERSRFQAFRDAFHAVAGEKMQGRDRVATVHIDVEAPLHVLNPKLLDSLNVLAPFGQSNPAPVLVATDLTVVGEPKRVGGGERHLSFRVRQGTTVCRAIAFGMAERAEELMSEGGKCCVVFKPFLNEFRGMRQVELEVRDFRAGSRVFQDEAVPCPTR